MSQRADILTLIAKAIKRADNRYFFEDYSVQAEEVYAALKKAGYVIVPKEPTTEMLEAGSHAIAPGRVKPEDHVRYIYTDMIATLGGPRRKQNG